MTTLSRIHTVAVQALCDIDPDAPTRAIKQIVELTAPLRPGDVVYLSHETRPKYIAGLRGTITEIDPDGQRARIEVDEPEKLRRYRHPDGSGKLCVLTGLLERA